MKRIFFLILVILFLHCSILNNTPKEIKAFLSHTEQYKELRDIMNKEKIDRMDVAHLFALFFYNKTQVDLRKVPLDMKLHFYPSLAYTTIENGIMTLFPDNSFKPNELVQKYQLAIFFTRYLNNADPFFDVGLKNKYILDVNPDFFAYKPINLMITRNIMELDENANFYPFKYLSGREAIKYFYRMESFYK